MNRLLLFWNLVCKWLCLQLFHLGQMSSNRFSESHSVAHRNREIEWSAVCLISPRILKNFLGTRILTSDCIVAFLHSKAEFIIYHASLNHASFHFYMATSNSGKIHFHINIWPHFDSNYCAEIQKINLVLWILLQPQYCSGSIVCKHSLKGLWHNIRLVGEDNWTQFQTRLFLVTKICFKKG